MPRKDDEFRQQREALKNKPLKYKIDYFWYYYKLQVLAVAFGLVLLGMLIHDIATNKATVFYAAFLNSFATEEDEQFMAEFIPLTGIDLNKYDVYLDTTMRFDTENYDEASMAAAQKFVAISASGDINVAVSERNVFANYADNGAFLDLRQCLTDEQLEKYREHFFYFDETVLNEEVDYEEIANRDFAIPEDTVDRRGPDSMEKPVPVGIFLDDSMKDRLVQAGYYADSQEVVLGFMNTTDSLEYCQEFLDWLVSEPEQAQNF